MLLWLRVCEYIRTSPRTLLHCQFSLRTDSTTKRNYSSWFLLCLRLFSSLCTLSTISSRLLVTSSSMTEDIYRTFFIKQARPKNMLIMSRVYVLVVAAIAVLLSLNPKESILGLDGNAWVGFGAMI